MLHNIVHVLNHIAKFLTCKNTLGKIFLLPWLLIISETGKGFLKDAFAYTVLFTTTLM